VEIRVSKGAEVMLHAWWSRDDAYRSQFMHDCYLGANFIVPEARPPKTYTFAGLRVVGGVGLMWVEQFSWMVVRR
jgi:hypothetical protein